MRSYLRGGLLLGVLFVGGVSPVRADFISSNLGSAGPSNFALLTLSGTTDIALNGPGTTFGNVGISSPGNLQLNSTNNAPVSNTAIVGNLYLGNTATVNNPAQVSGSIFTNQNAFLAQANTDAINASKAFAALPSTAGTPTAINGNTTINGGPGITVANVSGINLGNGQTLTLNGPAGSQFIINSPNMVLNSGKINLTGGVTPNDVVFNLTGTGNNLQTSGGLNNESVINGIVLDPKGGVAMAPGLINGELIAGGQSVHLVSGASVTTPPTPSVPEPASLLLAVVGGFGLTVVARRRARRARALAEGEAAAGCGVKEPACSTE
jgi:hypothetical protein